jgi:mannobiose 2-epimerase
MTIDSLRTSARKLLEDNILKFWIDNMQDKENGGFYGRIDGHNTLHPEAEKGAIINARILWTFSAAYRVLTDGQQPTAKSRTYLEMATRAKDYMIEHFIDHEYGGVYWSVDYKGNPLDTKKQFYAIGFAIYGLSEYARATGDREALDYALNLYECIEEHALDRDNNGYIEAMTRTWQPIADMRLSEHDANYPKSQNTHLHIIEPYTNLYRCLKEMRDAESCDYVPVLGSVLPIGVSVPMETLSRVEASLRNIINIFTDRILNPLTHHLDLFFENDWTRGAGQLESYGHDIECSWLMHEAAMVLGDQDVLKKMEPIVVEVAKASEKGLLPSGAMIHEADLTRGTVDDDLHWWVQAEAVVGFLNIYQYFGDEAALDNAFHCYQYILDELVDYENGELYWSRKPDGSINREEDKAGFWKCPYHNGRMCLEIIERFNT